MLLAVNVLPNSPKTADMTRTNFFYLDFVSDECKISIKVPQCRVSQCLRAANTLIHEGCSGTGAFWHSSNHIFRSH